MALSVWTQTLGERACGCYVTLLSRSRVEVGICDRHIVKHAHRAAPAHEKEG